MRKLVTYTGKFPGRSLGVHPPSGLSGEQVPYPKLETMLTLRTRLKAHLNRLTPDCAEHADYCAALCELDAAIQRRRDMKKT